CLSAGLRSWQKRRDTLLGVLFCRSRRIDSAQLSLSTDLESLDFAECHVARVASLQLALGLELIEGLLVLALGLLDLAVRLRDIGLGHDHFGVGFRNLAARNLDPSFLL